MWVFGSKRPAQHKAGRTSGHSGGPWEGGNAIHGGVWKQKFCPPLNYPSRGVQIMQMYGNFRISPYYIHIALFGLVSYYGPVEGLRAIDWIYPATL